MMTDDDALSVTLTSVIASLVFILAWRSEIAQLTARANCSDAVVWAVTPNRSGGPGETGLAGTEVPEHSSVKVADYRC